MKYVECEIESCDRLTSSDYNICHYHRSLLDRHCAYFYHKTNETGTSVQWCYKFDEPIYRIECDSCEERIEPIEHIELIEKITGLNQGSD